MTRSDSKYPMSMSLTSCAALQKQCNAKRRKSDPGPLRSGIESIAFVDSVIHTNDDTSPRRSGPATFVGDCGGAPRGVSQGGNE